MKYNLENSRCPCLFFRESGPGNQEDKTVISSVRLLRSRFHRPKPNLRTTSRKEVTDINKGVSQEDTNKKESSMQSTDECCVLLDTDVRLFFFFKSFPHLDFSL